MEEEKTTETQEPGHYILYHAENAANSSTCLHGGKVADIS
jgi:hypothetical protein